MQRPLLERLPFDHVVNFAEHVGSEKDPYSVLHMPDTNLRKSARLMRWLAERGVRGTGDGAPVGHSLVALARGDHCWAAESHERLLDHLESKVAKNDLTAAPATELPQFRHRATEKTLDNRM